MIDPELAWNLIHRVNVGDALTRTAAAYPQHEAVVDGARRLSYAELDAWVNRVASGLAARGYQRGDALGLMSGNSAEFLVTYYACAKLGVVVVPTNLGWRDAEASYVLRHARARGLVVEAQLLDQAASALAQAPGVRDVFVAPGTAPDRELGPAMTRFDALTGPATPPQVRIDDRDPITYLYTSGTTAAPKGVIGSHLAIHIESLTVALEVELRRRDRLLCLMPLFHTAQLNGLCTPAVTVGATMVLLRGFDA
jgi:acyl-CoA synthetase (AMP-forming)/AMP-acid ligase II